MASLTVAGATKRFGPKTVLDQVSLGAADGEFVALLGPSGCGKSTLLRLIAGFERLDEGRIEIGGEVVSGAGHHVPTEARRLGMVFQSYALWPHMSVAENVAFALEVQQVPADDRKTRVGAALETVGLSALAGRRPADLSGGQRQRVALARTLAVRARIVLLDEPLANLDANLRERMQEEFRRIHRESGRTMIFVTHDQAEALALADRVAVMMEGRLRQVDRPRALYDRPADPDVARFIGRGSVIPVTCHAVAEGRAEVAVGAATLRLRAGPAVRPGMAAASLRPEACRIVSPAQADGAPRAQVRSSRFTGPAQIAVVALEDGQGSEILALADSDRALQPGATVAIDITDGWVLPPATGA